MLINDTNLTLCKTTFADIAAAAPLKDVERWDDGWGLDCKTDGPIDVEGMRFRAFLHGPGCGRFLFLKRS